MIEVLACEYWYWQILIKQLHRVQANIRGKGFVNQVGYVFLGCFYQSQEEKWVWTINKM